MSPNDVATGDVDVNSSAATAPRRHSVTAAGCDASDSDMSDDYENYIGDDLEVNFESEADMLAVETSGDELEQRGGITTSLDFSGLSSQVTTTPGR